MFTSSHYFSDVVDNLALRYAHFNVYVFFSMTIFLSFSCFQIKSRGMGWLRVVDDLTVIFWLVDERLNPPDMQHCSKVAEKILS